jgi:hypothetical protein
MHFGRLQHGLTSGLSSAELVFSREFGEPKEFGRTQTNPNDLGLL